MRQGALVIKCRNPRRAFHSYNITEIWTRLGCIIGHGFVGLKPFFLFENRACFTFEFVLDSSQYGKLGNKCYFTLYQGIYCCHHSLRASSEFPQLFHLEVVLKSASLTQQILFSACCVPETARHGGCGYERRMGKLQR